MLIYVMEICKTEQRATSVNNIIYIDKTMSQNFNPNIMVYNLAEHEERVERIIRKSFTSSYMSNTKWEKLFKALDVAQMSLDIVLLKRVDRNIPYRTSMPKTRDLEGIWVSEGKNDCKYFYKEIEWMEFLYSNKPVITSFYRNERIYKEPVGCNQTIELAALIIESLGDYESEITQTGLRIYGYKN